MRQILHSGNYTSYVNTTNFPGLDKTGTVTKVSAGTGLTGGDITSSGTIAINSTYQTYISHGESAYNSLENYLPKTGGIIKNGTASGPLGLDTDSETEIGLRLYVGGVQKGWAGYSVYQGTYLWNAASSKYLGIKDDGTPHYNGSTLWHAGNLTSSAVQGIIGSGVYHPFSGGMFNFTTAHLFIEEYLAHEPRLSKAYLVINKGTDSFGMGPSTSNISVMALGTTSNYSGTWKQETLYLTDNGAIGVGAIPSYTFDVNGDSRISGKLYIGSSGAYLEYNSTNGVHLVVPSGKGFYTEGFISAGGVSSGGGTAGADLPAV